MHQYKHGPGNSERESRYKHGARKTQRERTNASWPGNCKAAQLTNVVPRWATSTGKHQYKHGPGNSRRERRFKHGAPANSTGTYQYKLAWQLQTGTTDKRGARLGNSVNGNAPIM